MRQMHARRVAGAGLLSSVKVWPTHKRHLAVGKLADTELRSLKVAENADRPAKFLLDRP